MCLSKSEQQVIKQSIYVLDKHAKIVLFGSRADDKAREIFGKEVRVVLFGSRVDKKARGGDIDLYIMVTDKNDLFNKELRFLASAKRQIGSQKIDVIYNKDKKRIVAREALRKGIEL
jgi:predicted nucleotidyltransferase